MNKPPSSLTHNWAGYFKSLARYPKLEAACKKAREQAKLVWIAGHGKMLAQSSRDLKDLLERFKTSAKMLSELETKLRRTDKYISSPQLHSIRAPEPAEQTTAKTAGKQSPQQPAMLQKVRFRDWAFKDIALLQLTLFGALGALVLGAVNLKANLLSSGNVLFIEQPELATALSCILPLGALALKFATNFMLHDFLRRCYGLLIYLLLFALVLVWSWLFAKEFPGLSAGVDLEQLLNGGNQGTWLVWTQLLIEMLAGTALFLAAERIYTKYSPNYYYDNPEYREIVKAHKKHSDQHQALIKQLGELQGQVTAMEAQREAFINQTEADFIAYHARFRAAQDSDLL